MSAGLGVRDLFAAATREAPIDLGLACGLIALAADPAVDVTAALAALDAFAALARPATSDATTPAQQAQALRRALGEQAGFAGFDEDYALLESSMLPAVLSRRRGLPILLSVVWLEVARRLNVPAYPVALPGHVVVAIGVPTDYVLVDPYQGGREMTVHDAAERVRSAGFAFTRELLAPTGNADLLLRVLANIRNLAAETDDTGTRLWAVQLSLAIPGHPATLRRELGELLGRRGDFLNGARELEAYAEAIEAAEPAAGAAARRNAGMLRSRLN